MHMQRNLFIVKWVHNECNGGLPLRQILRSGSCDVVLGGLELEISDR